ncbi:hypothetical protein [Foetidibacter luteolus]|uniref:hypothetical protein n=1 Tax=Foetidibacter luteolus TaxID=2608880 RepID=UPI00129A4056|nr:hypothetical protein [Foetidibacter luteolus]
MNKVLVSRKWLGEWKRQLWQNESNLRITGIQNDSLEFHLFALNGAHSGELEGFAIVTDETATYTEYDELDSCILEFKLSGDSLIVIRQIKGDCMAGMAVSYGGDYINEDKIAAKTAAEETLLSIGLFNNVKQDSLFRLLTGDKYSLFVNSTQLTSDEEDLDSLQVKVYASGVRGLFTIMENIIMTDSADHFWAAVLEDDKVYYFTNSEPWKKRLPLTIEKWRERFKDDEVVYE